MEIKREEREVVSFHLDAGTDPWLWGQPSLPLGRAKLATFSFGSRNAEG